MSEPVRVGDALDAFGAGGAQARATAKLWRAWPEIAGAALSAHVEPTSLRGGVLRLRADSPVWATEVSYLAEFIKARANEVLKGAVVDEVRIWNAPGRVSMQDFKRGAGVPLRARSKALEQADPESALRRAYEAWRRRRRNSQRWSERPPREGKQPLE